MVIFKRVVIMIRSEYNIAQGKYCMSHFQKFIVKTAILIFLINMVYPMRVKAEIKDSNVNKQEEELISQIESYYSQGKKSIAEENFLAAIVKFNHVINLEKGLCIVYTPYAAQYILQAKGKIREQEGASLKYEEKKIEKPHIDAVAPAGEKKSKISEYVIGEEDELFISVWQEEDLKSEVIVRPDGKISFPLVGDIPVAGLTFTQLNEEITQRLKNYIKYPVVSIVLRKLGGKKIIVLGEVTNPGVHSVTGEKTLLEAIALAGGFTQHAVSSSVILIRGGFQNPKGRKFNLTRAIDKADATQNVTLQQEDIIYVPKKFIANVNYVLSQIVEPLSHGVAAVRDVRYLGEQD